MRQKRTTEEEDALQVPTLLSWQRRYGVHQLFFKKSFLLQRQGNFFQGFFDTFSNLPICVLSTGEYHTPIFLLQLVAA